MKELIRYPKQLWVLTAAAVISVVGQSFLWPLNMIYIHEELGKSISVAGFILMLHSGAGIFGSLLGGYLFDKMGGKRSMLLGAFLAGFFVFLLAYTGQWTIYILLMILLGFSIGVVFPSIYAMSGAIWPEGGRKAYNAIYVANNLGVALGSALGGMVAQYSFRFVFLANAFTYVLFILMIWFGFKKDVPCLENRGQAKESKNKKDLRQLARSPQFLSLMMLCIGYTACWLSYAQWATTIASFMQSLGYSLSSYSFLWTINGILIVLFQPISLFLTDRLLRTIQSQILTGTVIFILSLVVLSLSTAYSGFVAGMVILTIGEIFVWPAIPTGASELAPEGKKGTYQGIVNGFALAGRTVGPVIGGLLYDAFSPQIMLYVMVFFTVFGFLCFLSYTRLSKLFSSETSS